MDNEKMEEREGGKRVDRWKEIGKEGGREVMGDAGEERGRRKGYRQC